MVALLKDLLVGTFRLVSLEARRSDGEISHPLGINPIGVFMFDGDGNFAVQLMNSVRSSHEAAVGAASIALFGTYKVDEDQQTFTATPEGAADPALIGTSFLRHVHFGDGVAVFNTPAQTTDGLETTTYITWKKVSPA
ncbi:MAG: hypothetical protein QOD72_1824 [Acidimicrobiaceae bacterium]|nr:hypothetical protein [Acidimicrobiaceae bacterium]